MNVSISLVVAVAENGVIGASGDMPWRLSTDLQRFKKLTLGKPMIMGRKTFDSIGKALPGRTTLVVTRDREWQREGVVVVGGLDAALELAREIALADDGDEICVVGGGEIYAQAMQYADTLHVTEVHAQPDGDTYFPKIDEAVWSLDHRETIPEGEKDTAGTTYKVFKRAKSK